MQTLSRLVISGIRETVITNFVKLRSDDDVRRLFPEGHPEFELKFAVDTWHKYQLIWKAFAAVAKSKDKSYYSGFDGIFYKDPKYNNEKSGIYMLLDDARAWAAVQPIIAPFQELTPDIDALFALVFLKTYLGAQVTKVPLPVA